LENEEMTNELEKQFFDTFGIEPKEKVNQTFNGAEFKVETIKEYPQITDRIYLELHCLLNSLDAPPYGLTVKEFKKDILISAIGVLSRNETAERIDNIKQQVKALFEEG
jgi:hypothetical protein